MVCSTEFCLLAPVAVVACRVSDPRLSVMNEADPSPINLDELRLLPDWLREEGPAPSKQYASHDYPTEERRGRDNRSGGFFGGDRRDSHGGGAGRPPARRDDRRSGPPPRRDGGRPFRDERGAASSPPPALSAPAPVHVEFLPDERCLVSINKQIRSTHLAYPLFGLARMFLQEPERHLVQFTLTPDAVAAGATLYQLGEDGPITLDRATLEKIAFDTSKDQFYVEQTVQKEPLKGNYTNVARDRQSGTLLGPTNYHGYQPALRSLYESRFSRRMSFEDFRHNIEVSTDPALIERWKEEARSTTTISTRDEPPTVLASLADARQHFRQHSLEGLLRTGTKLSVHGSVARKLPEPAMMQAIRNAHEQELRYPAQFVQLLRQGLQNAGLHIFKHRKRVVYVSLARPTPFVAHGAVSESVSVILETIAQSPLCTRKALAERVLAKSFGSTTAETPEAQPAIPTDTAPVATEETTAGEKAPATAENVGDTSLDTSVPAVEIAAPVAEDPLAKVKAALAADLRFLVQSGHIIEFHNGTFDLPLPPKPKEEPTPARHATAHKPPADVKRNDAMEAEEEPSEPAQAEVLVGLHSEPASEAAPLEPAEPSAVESSDISDPSSEAESTSVKVEASFAEAPDTKQPAEGSAVEASVEDVENHAKSSLP